MRDLSEIEDVLNEAIVLQAEGQNPYPGSNYVGGVVAALQWAMGDEDDPPVPTP